MQRVTGIGGVFFKAKDPKALAAWYQTHLGVPVEDWGGAVFRWQHQGNPTGTGSTVWSPFAADTSYFGPGAQSFMLNFRVADLAAVLQLLRDEGCIVDDNTEDSEFGKFGWVTDPEGNRIELWQPPEGQ
ncbi:VOC family protein [Rheinheimera sp.]|uniref:VOC family protein n=1 Tax=Rheinheimera sp. TaxID=1869214 RepID=UPI00307E8455